MNSVIIERVISSGSTLILDSNLSYEEWEGGQLFNRAINSATGGVKARFLPHDIDLPSPKTIFVHDIGDPRLTLIRSMPVAVEFWADHVSARSYDLEEFGIGADEFEAVNDLKVSVVDLYFLLKEEQANLGPLPQRQWEFLKGVIRET